MRKYVFAVEYGGLGDHLFYSPLPRLLKERGLADEVYLSSKSRVRSQQTIDLVWKTNPFLDGITDEPVTVFERAQPIVNKVINLEMAKHGVVVNEELQPEIFQSIETDPKYSGKKFIDLNYISYVGGLTPLDEINIVRKVPDAWLVNPKWYLQSLVGSRYVRTSSLLDFASLIASAEEFICLTSGGATLAAALNRRATVYFGYGHNPINRHSSNNNVQLGGDGVFRRKVGEYLKERNLKRESVG